jgi:hypothetical protein
MSNSEILNRHLFSSITRVYAVLDGASVPDLPIRLYEMKPPNFCLFTGELEPDMAFVAPYLVRLLPKTPFTEWVLKECWGKHWGIFVHSRQPINEMRKHFRALVTVYDEKGIPMTFRFYDPRVIRRFLPTCDAAQLKSFFGAVDAFFFESEDKQSLVRLQLENEKLVETPLPVA